ncbi:hypothetical protein BC628DRAFT_1526897 [Trametes gibbosa]|nr:hypothetical protein BC628DRAFT_1526897 [Trametes gibbosa]
MEEGEILADEPSHNLPFSTSQYDASELDASGNTYSPSLEWPEDVGSQPFEPPYGMETPLHPRTPVASTSCLRLLVHHSFVLRTPRKLALLDGYSEIQIGRDLQASGSDLPKIRLKELEVSKLHATIYWDKKCSQWSIVDMGSKHGTFIRPASSSLSAGGSSQTFASPVAVAPGPEARGVRLSQPRVASVPKSLHHLDHLSIGATTFTVHIHENRLPCTACSPQSDEEIPLFPSSTAVRPTTVGKRKLDNISVMDPSDAAQSRNPKKALAILKRSLLSPGAPAVGRALGSLAPHYVDRSARRRALYPDHSPATTPSNDRSRQSTPFVSTPAPPPPTTPLSNPSVPLAASNIGHRLLVKQGWQPGSALGHQSTENGGLLAPLEPPSIVGRAGLGAPARPPSSAPVVQNEDWRHAGKQRRWAETRSHNDVVP